MGQFTKAQRHAIYKKGLEAFDEGKLEKGLCYLLSKHTRAEAFIYIPYLFPELHSAAKGRNDGYYWSLTQQGDAARRRHLLKCIEMTKPTPKKK